MMVSRINILMAVTAAVAVPFISVLWFYREELSIPAVASAQEGASDYADIFSDEIGDDKIIAIVGGNSEGVIMRGDLRMMAEFQIVHEPELSMEDAIDAVIVPLIDSIIWNEEAIRLGHKPSDEEVQAYIKPFKVACDGPDGAPCRQLIKEQGYENREDYWKAAVEGYAEDIAVMNLKQAYLHGVFPDGATEEQEEEALAAYEASLREAATIDWKDSNLKAKYNALTVSASDLDETGQGEKSDSDGTDESGSDGDSDKNGELSGDTDSDGANASEDTEGVEGEGIGRPVATATPITIF